MSRGLLSLLLALCVALVAASDVLELGANSFESGIADKDIILVEFYAPWCGHCKRLAPEYEKAATALVKEDPPISLAKVDCPANEGVCGKYSVSGYPTLKIFRNGEYSAEYDGPRSADGIISFMKKQSGPSSREYDTVDAMKKALKTEEHTIVGFFTDEKSKLMKAFTAAADSLRQNFGFAHTLAKEVMDEYGFEDQVVIFRPAPQHTKLEESQVAYAGDASKSKLEDFIKKNFMGLAGVRTPDNAEFFDARKPLAVVYFNIDYTHNPKGSNYWRNRVIKVAKDFVDGVTFSVSSIEEYAHELKELGLEGDQEVMAALFDKEGKKYSMTDKFSVDNLRNFAQQFVNGELEPYIKSEPIPEDNDGPVKVVVGRTFEEIVNDETKDVLIEFYAPWCGHCKSLAPKYEELGEKLKDDPNIVIAKSDGTANDYPSQYQIRG